GVDGAGALRVAWKILQLRARLDLATAAPRAASAHSPACRQRRGARDRGQPPGADGLRLPVGRSRARRVRSLSRAGQEARVDPRPRALPPRAPRLRGRDERAGPRGGRAASRLLLAEAPELS